MLNRPNFTPTQALGTVGGGLLNLSQGKKIDLNNLLQQQKDIRAKQEQAQQAQMGEPNPHYTLPGNPIDTAAESLNVNPNLVPGGSVGGEDVIQKLMQAIGQTESGKRYGILGPTTKRGDRAYGQYQVMGANIPQWSQQVLGKQLSPEEFLANPEAQDAIAKAKLGEYYKKTGNINDASSMWFSGRPMRGNQSRDILGTSVPEYVAKVRGAMNPNEKFETPLSSQEEQEFQQWKSQFAPHDSGADYDLRGAFKAGLMPDKKTGHWPDTFKKPNHPTFSNQSKYARFAPNKAGTWNGETYIPHR